MPNTATCGVLPSGDHEMGFLRSLLIFFLAAVMPAASLPCCAAWSLVAQAQNQCRCDCCDAGCDGPHRVEKEFATRSIDGSPQPYRCPLCQSGITVWGDTKAAIAIPAVKTSFPAEAWPPTGCRADEASQVGAYPGIQPSTGPDDERRSFRRRASLLGRWRI